jgi:hypothetical protein
MLRNSGKSRLFCATQVASARTERSRDIVHVEGKKRNTPARWGGQLRFAKRIDGRDPHFASPQSASIGLPAFAGEIGRAPKLNESCRLRDRASWRCLHPHASAARERFPADNSFRRNGSSPGTPPRHHFAWATGRIARPSLSECRSRPEAVASGERRIPATAGKRRSSPSKRSSWTRHVGECHRR